MNVFLARALTPLFISMLALYLGACPGKHDGTSGAPVDHAAHDHTGHDHAGHDHPANDSSGPQQDHGRHADHNHGLADGEQHAHNPGEAGHDDNAHLDAKVVRQLDLKMAEVWPEQFSSELKIPGMVALDPDRRVTLSAPMTCRVVRLDATVHATVGAGQRLAWLEVVDADVRHQQIRAVEIRAERLAAITERDRVRSYQQALAKKGVAVVEERKRVEADLRVHDAKVRTLEASLDAVLASLRVAGLSTAQVKALAQDGRVVTRIGLYAPSLPGKPDLEVAARAVQLGQTVPTGGKLFELAALDRLQVIGEAFETDLTLVRRAAREELPVSLLFPAENKTVSGLKILAVEGALDGRERITHFFVWLPNKVVSEKTSDGQRYLDWMHRAGARVQILVTTSSSSEHFILPAEAVIHEAGKMWVYRQHLGGLDAVPIRIHQRDERRVVVPPDGGIKGGDHLVIQGTLRAHLALEQARQPAGAKAHAGHGHSH